MRNPLSTGRPTRASRRREEEATGQAIWSGTISFSLVAIPVRLVKAVEPGRISFRLLHSRDYSPLQRIMVCPREEKPVPPAEQIRGYEIGPDAYILVTDEELESVSPERSRTIDIVEFVPRVEVDTIYYDHPYYLAPARGGEKAYRLLAEVLHRTDTAGLAKFVLGEREYLVAVTSTGKVLSLITLHYHTEILLEESPALTAGEIADEEIHRMKTIIGGMVADFAPDKYADERRNRLLKLLKKKARKTAPVEPPEPAEVEGEGPVDLVAVLEKIMGATKKGR